MAHFARLNDSNIVEFVVVVDNVNLLDENGFEKESVGIQYLKNIYGQNTNWAQTSYNGNFRKRFAGPNDFYDNQRDAFIPYCPFASWSLNEETCSYDPPIPYPNDDNTYLWNEANQSWDLFAVG